MLAILLDHILKSAIILHNPMDSFNLHPTYFGKTLEDAVNIVRPERKAIIENFLYEKSALMLYADDGVGKSVLALQACLQSTIKGCKVFGEFNVPESRGVLFFQMERHPDENFERIKHLQNVIPFDKEKFALSVALQGTNLQDRQSNIDALTKVVEIVQEIGFTPDIFAFDPIYPLASSGLETAEACNAINNFFRIIQIYFNCTIFATSHTNRGVRDLEKKGIRVGKDMYGNRFLSAFFTGSYHIKLKEDESGTIWERDKNSQKNLEKKIELMYNASNYESTYLSDGKFSKKDKLDNYLKSRKLQDLEFSFEDMLKNSELSDSTLRGYLAGHLKYLVIESSILSKGKKLYKYCG